VDCRTYFICKESITTYQALSRISIYGAERWEFCTLMSEIKNMGVPYCVTNKHLKECQQ